MTQSLVGIIKAHLKIRNQAGTVLFNGFGMTTITVLCILIAAANNTAFLVGNIPFQYRKNA